MIRKTLIGLASAAALAAGLGATASTASATSIHIGFGFNDGYYNGGYDDVGYGYYHCHKKYKWVKVKVVFYDEYGYPHYKWKWVKKIVKFCHTSKY